MLADVISRRGVYDETVFSNQAGNKLVAGNTVVRNMVAGCKRAA